MMKKIVIFGLLLHSAALFAAPDLSAPLPPEVAESDLNFSAQEFQEIRQNKNNDATTDKQSNRNAKGALTQSIGDNRDGVKVIQVGGDTIEEYRRGGQVYQIRVVPGVGKPYYIQPKNENNDTDNKGNNPTSNWKVITF